MAYEENRERTVRHAREARRSQVRGCTRPADRSIKNERVCAEKCPLTMRHVAKRSGSCRNRRASAECTADAEAEHVKHGRSHAQAICQSKIDVGANQGSWRSKVTHLHAQRAKEEKSGAEQSSRPHAAREEACIIRERHAGRNGQPAAAPTRSQQTQ